VALAMTVVLAVSRGVLAFALAIVIATASTPARKKLALAATVVCVAVYAMLSFTVDPLGVGVSHAKIFRADLTRASLRTVASHPVFGVGPETDPGLNKGTRARAHLTPVNVAGQLGVPGLLAFLALLVLLWRERPRPTDWFLWAGMAALLLDGLANDIEYFRHLWVLFGLVAACSAFAQQTASAGQPGGALP
jgi:hypothetical protein